MPTLNLRLPDSELEILQTFCVETDRNQTDVIRSYIRSLEEKLSPKQVKPSTIEPYLRHAIRASG